MTDQGFKIDLSTIGSLISVVILAIVAFSIVTVAVYEMRAARRIQNQASITAEEGLTIDREFIAWGTLDPAENRTENITATNEMPVNVILSLDTENWDPKNASNFITLSWNYEEQLLAPSQSLLINLTLSVSPDIYGITDFTFDIIVSSQQKT